MQATFGVPDTALIGYIILQVLERPGGVIEGATFKLAQERTPPFRYWEVERRGPDSFQIFWASGLTSASGHLATLNHAQLRDLLTATIQDVQL